MRHKPYIATLGLAYAALSLLMVTGKRPTFSALEKRDLAKFPAFSWQKLKTGDFMRETSAWFADTEPYRDQLMSISMLLDKTAQLNIADDQVKIHATEQPDICDEKEHEEEMTVHNIGTEASTTVEDTTNSAISEKEGIPAPGNIAENTQKKLQETTKQKKQTSTPPTPQNEHTLDENAKIANAGIVISGHGQNTRALMAYSGGPKTGTKYAQVVNRYKRTFGPEVNVYCMIIPSAIEFYCPEKAKKHTRRQKPTIDNIQQHLSDSVKWVNIYDALANHTQEDIYLRTDHHWAPLGGYYAAKEFAAVAGLPFPELSDAYEEHRVKRYVGSMYGYSKDISVKQNPEDFVYHIPTHVKYTTTYTLYSLDERFRITGEGKPFEGQYFVKYKNGHGGAYCTFMGGDCKITKIKTSNSNGRRLLLLKDSFGNTLPGYLFYSFDEIHIVDFRYFTKNMVDFVHQNAITDILFAGNTFLLASGANCRNYERFLTQKEKIW